MADFSILDAPETPAALFAFRALKGAIFGSPNDDNEHNKENAIQTKSAHASRPKTSVTRAISFSPSKRRRANPCSSPAKSILRTPGIPTPRKQNTNVTFKDITPSLSPVPRRQEIISTDRTRVQTTEIAHGTTILAVPQAKLKSVKGTAASAQEPASRDQAPLRTEVSEYANTAFDIEAYKRSTEKEMKKLVRYGQKMREYARNQEQENTKLRIALELLQKENEGLRQREADRGNQLSEQEKKCQVTKEGRQSTGRDFKSASHPAKEPKPTVQLPTHLDDVQPTGSSMAPRALSPSMPRATLRTQRPPSPLKRKASTQLTREPPVPDILEDHGRSHIEPGKESNREVTGQGPQPASARLPSDRLAAARERVRRKAELRKAACANPSSPVNWDAL